MQSKACRSPRGEKVRTGAVLFLPGPAGVGTVEGPQVLPMKQVGGGEQIGGIPPVMRLHLSAQNGVVAVPFQPGVGVEHIVDPPTGSPRLRLGNHRIVRALPPANQFVVTGGRQAGPGADPVVDEHRPALLVEEGAAAEDAHLRVPFGRFQGRGMDGPVQEIGAAGVAPAVPAMRQTRILEDIEEVVPPPPEYGPVGIEGPAIPFGCSEVIAGRSRVGSHSSICYLCPPVEGNGRRGKRAEGNMRIRER